MRRTMHSAAIWLAVFILGGTVRAQQKNGAPSSDDKHCEMMKRGDQEMGFSQTETTHHFLLYKDGGAIEVEANNAGDTASVTQIRAHLVHIAGMFSAGNFEAPMFIHDTVPPGVPSMKKLHDQIAYQYEETKSGGRVRITANSAPAVDAVHAFLLFQIADHRTGDSPAISDPEHEKQSSSARPAGTPKVSAPTL